MFLWKIFKSILSWGKYLIFIEDYFLIKKKSKKIFFGIFLVKGKGGVLPKNKKKIFEFF